MKIDGILGFPLFRETILTLDYPHKRVLLSQPVQQRIVRIARDAGVEDATLGVRA